MNFTVETVTIYKNNVKILNYNNTYKLCKNFTLQNHIHIKVNIEH